LIFKLGQTHFDGPWRCKDVSLTYSSLTINLYFGPAYHLLKFGHVVFQHPVLSAYRDFMLPAVPYHPWGPCVFVRCAAVICRFLPHLRKVLEMVTFGSQMCHITHTHLPTHTLLNAY